MIRLTFSQLEMAVALATDLRDSEYRRDQLPHSDMITAWTGPHRGDPMAPRVEVQVPRAVVVNRLNDHRAEMIKGLAALGIDFDPAG